MEPALSLGPILFNWSPDIWRDFYYKIADEAPVRRVYVGEVVCSKRSPFFEPLYPDVIERLTAAGKEVVFSTLAEVMIKRERNMIAETCGGTVESPLLIEANEAAALYHLRGKPHAIGPFVNAYNEDTLAFLADQGAVHLTLPFELPLSSIQIMAQAARAKNITLEMMVYGRIPLALSARCYHARAHNRTKDNCQFVCEEDPDGMPLQTLEGKNFLTINGIQTLSHAFLNLAHAMPILKNDIAYFRLSPHTHDMITVAKIFDAILHGKLDPADGSAQLTALAPTADFANGFFHGKSGFAWVA